MKEKQISFELAKLAKEKGFNEPSKFIYNQCGELMTEQRYYTQNNKLSIGDIYYSSCTLSLLQKWLREVHNIAVIPSFNDNNCSYYYFIYTDIRKSYSNRICSLPFKTETYEEALKAGLEESLKSLV